MNYISCDLQGFISKTKDKKVLCFGGGSYFQIMCFDFVNSYPKIKLSGIIDNNVEKQGKKLNIAGFIAEIYSLERASVEFDFTETAILITTAHSNAVREQLNSTKSLINAEVYSYFELKRNSDSCAEELFQNSDSPIIPKVIHHCWFGKNEMPERLKRCIETWEDRCPDYRLQRWDESNYDIGKNAFLRKAYELRKWGFIPDYARLDIIYNEGDIYLDTDVKLVQSLENLRYNLGFIGTEITGGINGGSGFGAVKNLLAFSDLMKIYERGCFEKLLSETCVGRETGYFYGKGYRITGKTQIINDVTIYSHDVLSHKAFETGESFQYDTTISIHLMDGSWR